MNPKIIFYSLGIFLFMDTKDLITHDLPMIADLNHDDS